MSISFDIDSTTPDGKPADPSFGKYEYAVSNISFDFGGSAGTIDRGFRILRVYDDSAGLGDWDELSVFASYSSWPLEIVLRDNTGTVFSDDSIPLTLELADFLVRRATLDTGHFVSAELETMSWTVPEPDALALLALGVLVAVSARVLAHRRLREASAAALDVGVTAPAQATEQIFRRLGTCVPCGSPAAAMGVRRPAAISRG